jgi:hypothetical protein
LRRQVVPGGEPFPAGLGGTTAAQLPREDPCGEDVPVGLGDNVDEVQDEAPPYLGD